MFITKTVYESPFGDIIEPPTLEQVVGVALNPVIHKGVCIRFDNEHDEIVIPVDESAPTKVRIGTKLLYNLTNAFDDDWKKITITRCWCKDGYLICETNC